MVSQRHHAKIMIAVSEQGQMMLPTGYGPTRELPACLPACLPAWKDLKASAAPRGRVEDHRCTKVARGSAAATVSCSSRHALRSLPRVDRQALQDTSTACPAHRAMRRPRLDPIPKPTVHFTTMTPRAQQSEPRGENANGGHEKYQRHEQHEQHEQHEHWLPSWNYQVDTERVLPTNHGCSDTNTETSQLSLRAELLIEPYWRKLR